MCCEKKQTWTSYACHRYILSIIYDIMSTVLLSIGDDEMQRLTERYQYAYIYCNIMSLCATSGIFYFHDFIANELPKKAK